MNYTIACHGQHITTRPTLSDAMRWCEETEFATAVFDGVAPSTITFVWRATKNGVELFTDPRDPRDRTDIPTIDLPTAELSPTGYTVTPGGGA